jgi:hypothetical protein
MAKTNVKRIRPSMAFTRTSGTELITTATNVSDGVPAHPEDFPKPPVDGPTLKTQISTYAAALTAAADGGKKAKAEKKKQEETLIEMLRELAHYVEANCKRDMATFLSSGFQAVPIGPFPAQSLAQPSFTSIDHGASGELIVSMTPVKNAKTYEVQWAAAVPGAVPAAGAWSKITLPNAKPAPVGNLTPGTSYIFQVRAFGNLGYTEWSDPITRMCT